MEAPTAANPGGGPDNPAHPAEDPQSRELSHPALSALRPWQWVKNSLIFAPLFLAHDFTLSAFLASLGAFLFFCVAASSGYIVNDCLDLQADRAHPVKRRRSLARGALSPLPWFAVAALTQLALPFIAALLLPHCFAWIIACYIALNLSYSLKLKQMLFIDVIVLTSLYVLRVVAGAYAIAAPLSAWSTLCSFFAFLTLSLVKRLTELTRLQGTCSPAAKKNGDESQRGDDSRYISTRRAYRSEDRLILAALASASACSTVFTLILYAFEDAARHYYTAPMLIAFTSLPVFFAFGRLLILSCRGELRYDPVLFVVKDRSSLICALVCAVLYLLASFYRGPFHVSF